GFRRAVYGAHPRGRRRGRNRHPHIPGAQHRASRRRKFQDSETRAHHSHCVGGHRPAGCATDHDINVLPGGI
ncbi:hypothetical protein ABTC37_20205, partial [Acinetobacter baumannii]